jgi:ectoine hydroxylase-related dioxygenase (phytanoyl-CoA dioxygenase family)
MAAEQHSYQEHSEEQRQGLLDTLNRQGYVVIPDCIDPALLAPVNARVDELYAQQEDLYAEMAKTLSSEQAEQAAQALKSQAFILNLAGCGEEFTSLLTQPNLLNMVTTILGEDALLSSASMRDVFGGCEEQLIHTDDSLYAGRDDLFKRPIAKQLSLVATVALGDQLANRGATVIFPESHLWEEAPDVVEQAEMTSESAAYNERMRNWAKKHKKTEAIEVEMKAGSVVIWLGATWHAGGAYRDTEGEPRRAALFNFCRGIFRQQENQMAGITHEQAAGMPPAVQRLLGYSMSDTALGYSNGQDPALLLGEGGKALAEENQKRLAGMRGT